MASNPSSAAARMAKQMAVVIAASYLGAIFGLGLYTAFQMNGFQFQEIAGDKSIVFFPGGITVPIASVFACVLVSHYADHVRASKLGILLSLLASYVGVYLDYYYLTPPADALPSCGPQSLGSVLFWDTRLV